MEGIRKLERCSRSAFGDLRFASAPEQSLNVTHISWTADGFDCKTVDILADAIPSFLQDDSINGSDFHVGTHSLKLVHLPSPYPGIIDVHHDVFTDILQHIGLDRWVERLVNNWTYGYHHWTQSTSTQSTTSYLGTGHFTATWTTVTRDASQYTTKGVIIAQRDNMRDVAGMLIYSRIEDRLVLFDAVSQSPLYLPFVLSVDILTMRESILTNIFSSIRRIETITGHGSWGQGFSFPEDQNDIKTMTATLGTALNQLADIYKHLNMVDLLFTDLQALAPAMQYDGTNKVLCAGNKSITDAISIIRQQPSQARDQAQYLEVRVRSQSSVVSPPPHFLRSIRQMPKPVRTHQTMYSYSPSLPTKTPKSTSGPPTRASSSRPQPDGTGPP